MEEKSPEQVYEEKAKEEYVKELLDIKSEAEHIKKILNLESLDTALLIMLHQGVDQIRFHNTD